MWLQSSVLVVVAVAGWQDWRTRLVSNWLSIPLFAAGVIGLLIRHEAAAVFAACVVTVAARRGWMAGGDWKVLIGLFGLWPAAGYAALLAAAVWGAAAVCRRRIADRGALTADGGCRFPGVTAFALGVVLTFAGQLWYLIASN